MKTKKYSEIIWVSLKEAFRGAVWKWLLGGVGAPIAIFLFGKNFLDLTTNQSILVGFSIVVCVFLIRFFLLLIRNLIKYFHFRYKESSYGKAIILLKDSFSKVHALRKKDVIDDAEFMAAMVIFCNNLKRIFDETSKSTCSVSIKVPLSGPINESALVTNLCRNDDARHRDTDMYKQTKHSIIGNTPYQKVLNNILRGNNKGVHYINHRIDLNGDYENTSLEAYSDRKLPYKSELVYPIIPQIRTGNGNYDCLGFICIDSDKFDSFDETYDVAIVEGVADGLYDLIFARNVQKLTKKKVTKKQEHEQVTKK